MNKHHCPCKSVGGLTLVELLVAITLGAIILSGAITLFVNNRDNYKSTNELSRLQETARYALGMMVRDIRVAGYFGCADRGDTVTLNVPAAAGQLWDFNLNAGVGAIIPAIEGFESAFPANSFMPSGFNVTVGNDGAGGEVLANSDAITLRYMAGSMADVAPANGTLDYLVTANVINGTGSTVTVDSTSGFALNQVAAIADCGGADIFRISATPTATTVRANALSRRYNATSLPMIAPFVGVRYHIGDNGRGPGGEVYPSLYRTIIDPDNTPGAALSESTQELFEGVENMQILYGVDTSGNGVPDSYVPSGNPPLGAADPASNWANIVSVRIAILVRTIDQRGRDPDMNVYQVNNIAVGPLGDNRRRRVFTTTTSVRNSS
jgi:type IV pilus assembly protein PilW